jgi:pimeloyl-ACP methyl ester carboxylesterase
LFDEPVLHFSFGPFVQNMTIKSITYQSATLHYRVCGTGKPVVLLHGFGEDGEIWNGQVDRLQHDFRLIVPDLPGSGGSGMIPDMSIEGMAEAIRSILETEFPYTQKGNEVVMLGHSMGGYITLALAEKYPGWLKAIGLVHSTAFADPDEKKQARLKSISFMEKNGAYLFLKTSIPGLFMGSGGSKSSDILIADLVEKGRNFATVALVRYYRAMGNRPDRRTVLKNFKGPVLFLIGLHDTAVPFQQNLQESYLPAQSHIHLLRNSGHMGMLEEMEKMNDILLQFLHGVC